MSSLKVLFIGGTGNISSACATLAVERGVELTFLNRGHQAVDPAPEGVEVIRADIRDEDAARAALDGHDFDVVVDFVAFTAEHAATDVKLFRDRVGQYVFISSASAYQKPVARLPITESTPLRNPYWPYSRDKIAAEEHLLAEYRDAGFPVTIVRPSHTYDKRSIPFIGRWTTVERMRRGEPVIVPGDGTSLWVLTHHADFARAFVPLLGHPQTIGDAIHITSDQVLTWNQIYSSLGEAAGAEPKLVHLSSAQIAKVLPDDGPGLLGDKAHSVIFDNSKVKRLVPGWEATITWSEGCREIIDWYDADPARKVVDPQLEVAMNHMIELAGA
jgi:nucleoside-diphosphate-sugar epimerase